jgi:hypothetical protein
VAIRLLSGNMVAIAVDDRHGFGLAHIRQADETDALWVVADRVGQLLAGFETFR